MSIKAKLSIIMTLFAVVLLSSNALLSYFTTRDNLRKDGEANMILTAKQIALAVDQSRLSPEWIIQESMQTNDGIIEVMGIRPNTFERTQQPLFGTYQYKSDSVVIMASKALNDGSNQIYDSKINGKRVLDGYIPIQSQDQESYVIRIILNYKLISEVITKHMLSQLTISVILLQVIVFVSYILAGQLIRPIQDILAKVSRLSTGDFDARMNVGRKDELGQLAARINAMASSIGHYMNELQQKSEENQYMKEHLESIINQTADAIHVADLDGNILRVNSAFESLFGWTSDEIVGTTLDFIPPSLVDEHENCSKEVRQGRPFVLTETIRLRKDGSEVHVSISESPVYDEHGIIVSFISISRDMTEHNKMEELLRRSEKLTTVGQLAAGVAHEIRNPLTTLKGFLQMQQRTKVINQQHTDIMLSELDRINLIVSEFLILAKPQAVQFEVKDVRFTLGDVISLLDSEAHLHNIEFETHFSLAPILVHCEENQLKQVFINILKNAMESMPGGGIVTLHLDDEDGQDAIIRIIDRGEGISKERLEKLGEPFYTNKEKGTGLGLMVTQRIIEGHKGKIHFDSKVGSGTVVTITLPQAELLDSESLANDKSLA